MLPGHIASLDASLAFVAGNTWLGIPSITITPTPATTLSTVTMTFRKDVKSALEVTLTSPTDITITNATAWVVAIPAQALALPAGTHLWQLTFTDSASTIQTYLEGSILVEDAI